MRAIPARHATSTAERPAPYPAARKREWRGVGTAGHALTHRVRVALSASESASCAIMQDRTADVAVDGLPATWPGGANTATLPCGHVFHPSALALHFAVRCMRCPVCRAGADCKVDPATLPKAVRAPLQARAADVPADDDDSDDDVEIDYSELLAPLQLLCRMRRGAVTAVLTTRVLLPQTNVDANGARPPTPQGLTFCGLHRSFQRQLAGYLRDGELWQMEFRLAHPLVPFPLVAGPPEVDAATMTFHVTCAQVYGAAPVARVVVTKTDDALAVTVHADLAKLQDLCANFLVALLSSQLHD